MIVSNRVGKFLKERFGYNAPSLYVYDNGEKKFSLEPALQDPIPAPDVWEAVEFLWEIGLKIYSIPEEGEVRGIIQVGDRKVKMKKLDHTLSESYTQCLEFLCGGNGLDY